MTDAKPEGWFDDRVEAYVDGELPSNERNLFEARLAMDETLARAVKRARKLSATLAEMPAFECPDDLARSVLQMTRTQSPLRQWGWPAGVALAAVLALAVGVTRLMPTVAPADEPDAATLAQARADVALALAYLDRAGQVTARAVGEQVVTRGVIDPMEAGVMRARAATHPGGETI